MTKLVILESPGKIKKVSQFLKEIDKNNNYIVKASIGHVRELEDSNKYQIGINFDTMNPSFIISKDKFKVVKDLIEEAKKVDEIILATDPDREGEVIAWHLYDILKKYNTNFKRIKLNAITKEVIKKELNNLSTIDMNYVNSGLSRAYLDKITGYLLSKILQDQNIGISGGRVQSSVLRLLTLRENEINSFVKEQWFILKDEINLVTFKNVVLNNEKYEIKKYKNFNEVNEIRKNLNNYYIVEKVKSENFIDKAFINFTTSDFLQTAKNKLKLKVKEATQIAQSLFEKGLITYIRTDSTKLDKETEQKLIEFVIAKFGSNLVGKIHSKNEKQTDQEGHPPITPTHFEWIPENVQNYCSEQLSENEIKVYELIWKNTINSALKRPSGNKNTYILNNQDLLFLGEVKEYLDYGYYEVDKSLVIPESQKLGWSIGQKIDVNSIQASLQNSNPKSRFNEATLIKELERLGIGRPSTFKTSVEVNISRNYVEIDKKDSMFVTNKGLKVDMFLSNNFKQFINLEFTKNMENDLDLIANGKLDHKNYIKNYFNNLEKEGKKYMIEQIKCPKCENGFLRQAKTKTGVDLGFKSCSNWKNCDFKDQPEIDLSNARNCEGCKTGSIVPKRYFDKKTNEIKSFDSCTNYPNCKWNVEAIQKCGLCSKGWLVNKTSKEGKRFIACNNYPECKFTQF